MLHLKSFCFNPFQENTYVLYDDALQAFIVDPGNSNNSENEEIKQFLMDKQLKPQRLLLTHAHLDHVLGNRFVYDTYGLLPEVHVADLPILSRLPDTAAMYGVPAEASPVPEKFIADNDLIHLGKYAFRCIHAPGHSPGSICFYNVENKILLAGDVLFSGSIGRTDLPMGDHAALISSIKNKLFLLPDEVNVFPGHGPSTTIGQERRSNPFLV